LIGPLIGQLIGRGRMMMMMHHEAP